MTTPVGRGARTRWRHDATEVPRVRPTDVTLVDGRSFAISDSSGDMHGGVHGFVHDDVRHLSELVLSVVGPSAGAADGAARRRCRASSCHGCRMTRDRRR